MPLKTEKCSYQFQMFLFSQYWKITEHVKHYKASGGCSLRSQKDNSYTKISTFLKVDKQVFTYTFHSRCSSLTNVDLQYYALRHANEYRCTYPIPPRVVVFEERRVDDGIKTERERETGLLSKLWDTVQYNYRTSRHQRDMLRKYVRMRRRFDYNQVHFLHADVI